MSLVIAIREDDRVVLGSDRQVSTGGNKDHTSTKIWEVKDLPGAIMGGVGSARASQIIQCSSIVDKNAFDLATGPDTEFIITALAPTIVGNLKMNGINVGPNKDEDGCTMMPNAFIFAYKDRAWVIWHDLSVIEIEDYFAIGSGADVARGGLGVLNGMNIDPFKKIVKCIDVAAETTLFVDDGVDLLCTEHKKGDAKLICDALGVDLDKLVDEMEEEGVLVPLDKEEAPKKKAPKKQQKTEEVKKPKAKKPVKPEASTKK